MGVARRQMVAQLFGFEKVHYRHLETRNKPVSQLRPKPACALQHIVNLGLRDSQHTGKPAFRKVAVLNAGVHDSEQPCLENPEAQPRACRI